MGDKTRLIIEMPSRSNNAEISYKGVIENTVAGLTLGNLKTDSVDDEFTRDDFFNALKKASKPSEPDDEKWPND